MAMKRPDAEGVPNAGTKATDEVLAGFYPTLHEHLTETQWDDGKVRRLPTLMILTENGRWKAFYHCRDSKRGFWVTAEAYEQLLGVVETALTSSSTEWRKDTR